MEIRIAVCTTDKQFVDQHFGKCRSFSVVRLMTDTGEWMFGEDRTAPQRPEGACGHDPEYLNAVAGLLGDCQYLMVKKIGNQPARALERAGVQILEIDLPLQRAVEQLNAYVRKAQRR